MITSVHNKHLKSISKLRQRKYRDRHQSMMIEGYRAIAAAIENDYPLDELLYCSALFRSDREDLLVRRMRNSGLPITETSKEAFWKIADSGRPQGLMAIAPISRRYLGDHSGFSKGLYLILESIEKPGNLGSIVRSADAAGINGVIICNPRTDIYHPKCISASKGSVFSVPLMEESTEQTLSWCRKNSLHIFAASPHARTVHTRANMKKGIALAIGNEQTGLSKGWMSKASVHIKIPMLGQADSLNVAAAATVLLYEAIRQRSEH